MKALIVVVVVVVVVEEAACELEPVTRSVTTPLVFMMLATDFV